MRTIYTKATNFSFNVFAYCVCLKGFTQCAGKVVNFERSLKIISMHNLHFSLLILANAIRDGCSVYNGKVARGTEFSYTVSIQAVQLCGVCSLCTGAIISKQHILTAAHCVSEINDPKQYKVIVQNFADSMEFKTYFVEKFYRHPGYKHRPPKLQCLKNFFCGCLRREDFAFRNDVAVMKLETALPLGESLKQVKLPDTCSLIYSRLCYFSGFGASEETSFKGYELFLAPTVRWTELTILEPEECQKTKSYRITSDLLCTQDLIHLSYPGDGDSGGPLVCNGVVYGVFSSGALNVSPGIFCDVVSVLDFINDALKG